MGQAFSEISAGLEAAIAHAKGESTDTLEHIPEAINVKPIRENTGMSQQNFCAAFGISIGTLRHWEQGLRSPKGASRVLLKVIKHNPVAIIEVMHNKT